MSPKGTKMGRKETQGHRTLPKPSPQTDNSASVFKFSANAWDEPGKYKAEKEPLLLKGGQD